MIITKLPNFTSSYSRIMNHDADLHLYKFLLFYLPFNSIELNQPTGTKS